MTPGTVEDDKHQLSNISSAVQKLQGVIEFRVGEESFLV